MTDISQRKLDHLQLCLEQNVQTRQKTTYLDEVELIHQSLPEIAFDQLDLTQTFLGKTLQAPLLISGMTGGTNEATAINRTLATVAEKLGIAFGLGSQRAMLDHPSLATSYTVRDVAPTIPIIANLGAVQVRTTPIDKIEKLLTAVDANALAIHLNAAQEMLQPEGDRNFSGLLQAIEMLSNNLSRPVIVKETGAGLSIETVRKLASAGVQWIDTAGSGGTTWTGVETLRNPSYNATDGDLFWDWGIPTAASIAYGAKYEMKIIGSGGIRNGLDVAKAIALGARIVGMALPWLRAYAGSQQQKLTDIANIPQDEAIERTVTFGNKVIHTLKIAMLLTASKNLHDLRRTPRIIGPRLKQWIELDKQA